MSHHLWRLSFLCWINDVVMGNQFLTSHHRGRGPGTQRQRRALCTSHSQKANGPSLDVLLRCESGWLCGERMAVAAVWSTLLWASHSFGPGLRHTWQAFEHCQLKKSTESSLHSSYDEASLSGTRRTGNQPAPVLIPTDKCWTQLNVTLHTMSLYKFEPTVALNSHLSC